MKISKDTYYILKEYMELDAYIYKRLSDAWYLCRLFKDKKSHPIGYHILILKRFKVRWYECKDSLGDGIKSHA